MKKMKRQMVWLSLQKRKGKKPLVRVFDKKLPEPVSSKLRQRRAVGIVAFRIPEISVVHIAKSAETAIQRGNLQKSSKQIMYMHSHKSKLMTQGQQ